MPENKLCMVANGDERMQTMKIQYNKLWKLLIDKSMKRVDLRKATGISANSIAKLGKNDPVRMDVLMKIAEALDCRIEDLFETIKD